MRNVTSLVLPKIYKIPIGNHKFTTIDDFNFNRINFVKWKLHKDGRSDRYQVRTKDGVYLHRFLMGLSRGDRRLVDHIDINPLNNCVSNLRVCSKKENSRNRPTHKNNSSGFKGVSFSKLQNKYRASIRVNRTQKHLGYYSSPEIAAMAYNDAAEIHFGIYANKNKI